MLKALSLVGSARVLSTAAQAVTLLLMARYLAPTDFGEFAGVLGGLMALNIISDGGATYAVGRHHRSAATVVEILRAGRFLSGTTLLISVPVLATLAYTSRSPVLLACLPLCVWVPLERQLEVSSAYLLALGRDSLVGAVSLLRRVVTLGVILMLPAGVSPVAAYSVTMLVAAVVATVIVSRSVGAALARDGTSSGSPGRPRRWMPLPVPGTWAMLRPYWAAIAGQGVRQLDVAVLSAAAGAAAAGFFAPASRLVPALLLVPGTYTQLLLARMSATGERLTVRPLLVVGAVTTVAFGVLAATASRWVPLLLGQAYAPSVAVVQIVIGGLVFATLSSIFASALHATDRATDVAAAVWCGAVVTLVLVAVLGDRFGAPGAAWAVALGYALQCVAMAAVHRARSRAHTLLPAS